MKNEHDRHAPQRMSARHWAGLTLLVLATIAFPACRDKDDKGSPKPAEAASNQTHGIEKSAQPHEHGADAHAEEVKLAPDAIERYGIKTESASLRKLTPTFLAPARVAFNAEAMAHVGSPLPGRVADLRVRLGDIVKKGDVLLVVESPALGESQSEFLQKRINAQTAVSAVDLAKNGLDRATHLYDQNRGIALDEVQKREAEYKSALAGVQTAQSAALAAENKLHLLGMNQAAVDQLRDSGEVNPRFDITAPLPGRVVEREVTLGELVSPEKEALIVIADTTTLWVLADVPEARLPQMGVGAAAWVRTGSGDGHKHEGTVSYISPMVDPRTRSAQIRVEVHCEHGTLWPGMFQQVEIAATDRNNPDSPPALTIPEEAIQTVEGVLSVFVPQPNEPGAFAKRRVRVGRAVGDFVPVLAGLKEGELVVVAGSFLMKAELGKGSAEHED